MGENLLKILIFNKFSGIGPAGRGDGWEENAGAFSILFFLLRGGRGILS